MMINREGDCMAVAGVPLAVVRSGLKLAGLVGAALLVAGCTSAPPGPPPSPGPDLGSTYSNPPDALQRDDDQPRIYVAPNGTDENPGTEEAPLLTIKKASTLATPGTTVVVANGTYEGTFNTRTSGEENARITYVSATKWGAKLEAQADSGDDDDDDSAVWRNYGDYVDIQGFDLSGSVTDGILQTGSYGRILENRVHGFSEGCISTYKDDYSMVENDIIGNVVFGCGTTKLHHGIYPGGPSGTISNNISYGNAGFGIHCWHNCNNQIITNNLLFGNGEGGILIGQGDGPNDGSVAADNMLVANNIVIDNGGSAGIRESGTTGEANKYEDNIVVGNAVDGIGLRTGSETNTITSQPGFVNFQPDGSGDYRLLPDSPGVDAGTTDGAPATDIAGTARPQGGGIDIGVFEQ
jgi:hypothetical protein